METKKTTIREYIARRIIEAEKKKEETQEEKREKEWEEFYLK
jgi:hypothetical protein